MTRTFEEAAADAVRMPGGLKGTRAYLQARDPDEPVTLYFVNEEEVQNWAGPISRMIEVIQGLIAGEETVSA